MGDRILTPRGSPAYPMYTELRPPALREDFNLSYATSDAAAARASRGVAISYTRECLAIDVAGSIRSGRVIEVLSQLVSVHGAPRYLRSDNGPEFVSRAILKWAAQNSMEMALNDPGKPWQNGADESFNGKFRDECLSLEWFRTRTEAKVVIEQWRRHYNGIRPHSSLAYLTPDEFKQQYCSTEATEAVPQA